MRQPKVKILPKNIWILLKCIFFSLFLVTKLHLTSRKIKASLKHFNVHSSPISLIMSIVIKVCFFPKSLTKYLWELLFTFIYNHVLWCLIISCNFGAESSEVCYDGLVLLFFLSSLSFFFFFFFSFLHDRHSSPWDTTTTTTWLVAIAPTPSSVYTKWRLQSIILLPVINVGSYGKQTSI